MFTATQHSLCPSTSLLRCEPTGRLRPGQAASTALAPAAAAAALLRVADGSTASPAAAAAAALLPTVAGFQRYSRRQRRLVACLCKCRWAPPFSGPRVEAPCPPAARRGPRLAGISLKTDADECGRGGALETGAVCHSFGVAPSRSVCSGRGRRSKGGSGSGSASWSGRERRTSRAGGSPPPPASAAEAQSDEAANLLLCRNFERVCRLTPKRVSSDGRSCSSSSSSSSSGGTGSSGDAFSQPGEPTQSNYSLALDCGAAEGLLLRIRPVSRQFVDPVVELLTSSFEDYFGGFPTHRPLLRYQISVYIAQRLMLFPQGVILVATTTAKRKPAVARHLSASAAAATAEASSAIADPASAVETSSAFEAMRENVEDIGRSGRQRESDGGVEESEEEEEDKEVVVAVTELSFCTPAVPSFVTLNPPTGSAYLCNMAVDHRFRRLGVARTLLNAAEELAAETGAPSVHLHCRLIDEAPLALYSSAGYTTEEVDGRFAPLLTWQRRRRLMCKSLVGGCGAGDSSKNGGGGS